MGIICSGLRNTAAAFAVSVYLFSPFAHAEGAAHDWDPLPKVSAFVFVKQSVGLITSDSRYFRYERGSQKLDELSREGFLSSFQLNALPPPNFEVVKDVGLGAVARLKTHDGLALSTRRAYCAEGSDLTSLLWLNSQPLKTFVSPCATITSAETMQNQLWLGTELDGEYGVYGGEGVYIQSLDGEKLIKKLDSKSGLTGDIIRTIQFNPTDGSIWIATEYGLNTVRSDLNIVGSVFLYQDFNPLTGHPTIFVSPTKKSSSEIAEFARRLALDDYLPLYNALQKLPRNILGDFIRGVSYNSTGSETNHAFSKLGFTVADLKPLAPFILQSAQKSSNKNFPWILDYVCSFDDRANIDFVLEKRSHLVVLQSSERGPLDRCIQKYTSANLIPSQSPNLLAIQILKQEETAIYQIQAAAKYDSAGFKAVLEAARRLQAMANETGLELIKKFLDHDLRNPSAAYLYEYIGLESRLDDSMSSVMEYGLTKFETSQRNALFAGCSYFNAVNPIQGVHKRYGVQYASAILAAMQKMREEATQFSNGNYKNIYDTCAVAFASQMSDPATKSRFMSEVLPKLPLLQKSLASAILTPNDSDDKSTPQISSQIRAEMGSTVTCELHESYINGIGYWIWRGSGAQPPVNLTPEKPLAPFSWIAKTAPEIDGTPVKWALFYYVPVPGALKDYQRICVSIARQLSAIPEQETTTGQLPGNFDSQKFEFGDNEFEWMQKSATTDPQRAPKDILSNLKSKGCSDTNSKKSGLVYAKLTPNSKGDWAEICGQGKDKGIVIEWSTDVGCDSKIPLETPFASHALYLSNPQDPEFVNFLKEKFKFQAPFVGLEDRILEGSRVSSVTYYYCVEGKWVKLKAL